VLAWMESRPLNGKAVTGKRNHSEHIANLEMARTFEPIEIEISSPVCCVDDCEHCETQQVINSSGRGIRYRANIEQTTPSNR